MDIPTLNLPGNPGRMPWKPIGIALLILSIIALLLYLTIWRANRRLKRQLAALPDADQAAPGPNNTVSENTGPPAASSAAPFQAPAGYAMPILNPGLKFTLQPVFDLPYPAFNAWNTAATLRVLAVLDTAGSFGASRAPADSKPAPAWVLQRFSAGGAQLQETHLPIAGDQPDGKRLVAEIRALLETGLDETPNPESPQPENP